jgi:DNA-binding beta-propeller fold protein YncE
MDLGQARVRLVGGGAALAAAVLMAGCGSAYRPVVTPIYSTGPAPQVQSYAYVVSAPSPTTPGIVTVVDYSGDSILAVAPIGNGPTAFTMDGIASYGYTFNSDHTISNFPITTMLQAKNVLDTTLPSTAAPLNFFTPIGGLWATDLDGNVADVFNGFPQTFKLSIPVGSAAVPATTPVTIGGLSSGALRYYAISQNIANPDASPNAGLECNLSPSTQPAGTASSIEIASYTVSGSIPLGKCPVYGVTSPDGRRFFVLNRGDDTITVINSQLDTLDSCTPFQNQSGQTVTCHPTLPLSTAALTPANAPVNCNIATNPTCGMPAVAGPVYAEYNQTTAQLVVADYDGGTISVIDVSEDEYGNDSPTFGTTYTIPVGNNPASVTVLADGTRAYTANQTDQTVTIVTLSSHTVEKTLPITGHPRTVVSTQNSQQGKVYVASPDSPYLTIIRTDLDLVDTTVLVEGNIVDVRVTTQNGSQGNSNTTSRIPGYGEPCNLPNISGGYSVPGAPPGTTVQPTSSLANCNAQSSLLLTLP